MLFQEPKIGEWCSYLKYIPWFKKANMFRNRHATRPIYISSEMDTNVPDEHTSLNVCNEQ